MRKILTGLVVACLVATVALRVRAPKPNVVIQACTSLECIACTYTGLSINLCILATGG